ncbi:MAG TPA: hypothetical protein VLM75_12390 [Spirochaetota bacterium]|nr:hypothetical protein [Spirochaetota bacterium]
MKLRPLLIPAFVIAVLAGGAGKATADVAFGYLHNRSGNANYDYLETIFPNSFASSLASQYALKVHKPAAVDERLKKHGAELKKTYTAGELAGVAGIAGADYFITGSFLPLPGNRIEIRLSICERKTLEVFSFTSTGRMETEIFRLVDRVALVVATYLRGDGLYKTRAIPAGTRIALITNVSGEELNRFYLPFLEKGYPVLCAQNNDTGTVWDSPRFAAFRYVTTKTGSFEPCGDARKVRFYHGPWNNARFDSQVKETRELFSKYDGAYAETKEKALERMAKVFRGSVDVLMIVGFSEDRRSSWVRAFDMKDRSLLWMQSNLRPDSRFDDPVAAIAGRLADEMATAPGDAPAKWAVGAQ